MFAVKQVFTGSLTSTPEMYGALAYMYCRNDFGAGALKRANTVSR